MKKFKRTERITLLIVFLATVPILVFTFINTQIRGGDLVTPFSYWIWSPVIMLIIPAFLVVSCIAFMSFSPMTNSSKTRYAGAAGMMVSSYIYAAFLWIYSLGVVWIFWRTEGIIVGLCLGYVGIIPEAFLAALISGHLGFLIPMAVLAGFFKVARARMKYALKEMAAEEPEVNPPSPAL